MSNTIALQTKKITLATLKSFINKANNLYVETHSDFDGMSDCVMPCNTGLKKIEKNDAIGFKGVYLVGGSRNSFQYVETETHYGINVYNCCGSSTIYTDK